MTFEKILTADILKCDGLLNTSEIDVIYNSYNSFEYGWKANRGYELDQGHWNNLIIGPKFSSEEGEDHQLDARFMTSKLNSIWLKCKMVYGERKLLRCYFNSYTYGTEGYTHTDVTTSDYKKYEEQGYIAETILFFCNDEWSNDWAGETVFFNQEKTDIIYSVMPKKNRSLCFAAHIPHTARSPSRACHKLRKILAFKTLRKKIDEKRCVEYINNTMKDIPHSKSTFSEHLIGTYNILKNMNMPQDVCAAGLFHAVYGTEFFDNNNKIDRDTVRNMIGDYAENLAYTFSTLRQRCLTIMRNDMQDEVMRYHLACIEYANLLEQQPRISVKGIEEMKNIITQIREV